MDVFNSDTSPVTSTNPLEDLVGEGKKFKDVEALAKGKLEADAYIERLKAEAAEARQAAQEAANAKEQFEALKREIAALKEQNTTAATEKTPPTVTETDIEALVSQAVTKIELTRTANQNISSANSKMVEKYGSVEKAKEVLNKRATELNLTVDALKSIAERSPTAFLQLVDVETPNTVTETVVPSTSTVRPPNPVKAAQVGTKEYFDKLRSENPKKYWTQEVQSQIWNAVKAGTYELSAA